MDLPDQLGAFLLTALVLEVTPGPNMAWLALLSASAGRRAGLAAVSGVALGLTVQAILAAIGVAALVQLWPGLFQALHFAGVGFLVWLAWQSWRDAATPAHHLPGGGEGASDGFRLGLITNLLNPKAAVFFLTILPGFLVATDRVGDVLLLSAIYLAIATLVHLIIALAAGGLRPWLADPTVSVWMHRFQAVALVLVAIWLLGKG